MPPRLGVFAEFFKKAFAKREGFFYFFGFYHGEITLKMSENEHFTKKCFVEKSGAFLCNIDKMSKNVFGGVKGSEKLQKVKLNLTSNKKFSKKPKKWVKNSK